MPLKQYDRFSKQTKAYEKSRPQYPIALYEFLASIVPSNENAWDCATGNGQAALHLSKFFKRVYATDLSEAQISNAFQHERISYEVTASEDVNLTANSIDLITVAQAVHWFDLDKFYSIAKSSLKPGGIIALWAYDFIQAKDESINKIFQKVGQEILKDFWDENVKMIWKGYEALPFPFEEIQHPKWLMCVQWRRNEFISYIESWSASQKYYETSVIEEIIQELNIAWPCENQFHRFEAPLTSRIGSKGTVTQAEHLKNF